MTISLSFDVEPDLHSGEFRSISEGLPLIANILRKNNVKATFFTTCDCIEEYPEIFKQIQREGHEIALHGYRHSRFDDLSTQEREESIKKSLEVFRKYLNEVPRGFRAPQHSINKETLELLRKYNIKYDSSKTPLNLLQVLFFPKRIKSNLNNFFSTPYKHKINGIQEIPTTSFVVPFVSLIPRVLPRWMQKAYMMFVNNTFDNLVFYAHSWDFISVPESKIDRKFSHKRVVNNFDFIIRYMKRKNQFVKMEELL